MDYEKIYKLLFNAITDATEELLKSKVITAEMSNCVEILKKAQCEAEEIYIC